MSLCADPAHAEPFTCHCMAEGGWDCEGWIGLFRLSSLQQRVGQWHFTRFPEAQMEHVALKTTEEVGEVASAVNDVVGRNSASTRNGDVPGEAADVVITLMVLLQRWFPGADLLAEVEKKLGKLNDPNSGHRAALKCA